MAVTALYRLSSGECLKVSVKGQSFEGRNTNYWGMATDPILPNGNDVRDPTGEFKILGYAKIFESPNTIRNATQAEIDTFANLEEADENKQDMEGAREFLQSHPRFRKLMVAFADVIIGEINILRAQHSLSDRTLLQFKNAIINRISEND